MTNTISHLLRAPVYILGGLSYHLGGILFTPKPRMIQFPVCDRCNARCIMCNRWQKDTSNEISLETIRKVFGNNLFKKVEEICLHGGEPTLRKDLADICSIVQKSSPRLKRLWISTNGFGPRRIEKRIREILEILDFTKLSSLDINVSIDGINETHDKIRGVKGGFKQTIETVRMLTRLARRAPLQVTIGTVIQPLNLYELDELEKVAMDLEVPILFQPLMFDKFFNIPGDTHLKFTDDDLREFKKVIATKLTNGSSTTSFYWCHLLSMMKGAKRRIPCAFDRYVFSLYPTGEVLPCSREDWILFGNVYEEPADKIWFSPKSKEIRQRMRKEVCPTCSSYCGVEFSLQKEFFAYLRFYLRKTIFNFSHLWRS